MKLGELDLILKRVNKNYLDFDIFIETGSFVGETMDDIKNSFYKIISIEITDKYFDYCRNKFINYSNIEIIHGDSLNVLPLLIEKYNNERIMFFLDAHYSAGDTGKNHLDVPLIEELKIINRDLKNSCLVIIDDADLFGWKHELLSWEEINEKNILEEVKGRVKNYFYIENTIKAIGKTRFVIELENKEK